MANDPSSLLGTQITASAIIVFLFRILEQRFPKLQSTAPWIKRTSTWLLAGIAAAGIHIQYNVATGGLVTIPPLAAMLHGSWDWLRSIAIQEWMHQSTRR